MGSEPGGLQMREAENHSFEMRHIELRETCFLSDLYHDCAWNSNGFSFEPPLIPSLSWLMVKSWVMYREGVGRDESIHVGQKPR